MEAKKPVLDPRFRALNPATTVWFAVVTWLLLDRLAAPSWLIAIAMTVWAFLLVGGIALARSQVYREPYWKDENK